MSVVFIIGAGTFFGQHLCQQFAQAGWRVLACSRKTLAPAPHHLPLEWIPASFQANTASAMRPLLKAAADAQVVIYAGGFQGPNADHASLYEEHVVRTASILHFCRHLPRLKHYYQTSTIRVAGEYSGLFQEDTAIPSQNYQDSWAGCLYAAEKLVLNTATPFPKSIIRLGEIMGSARTGEFPRVSGFYHILLALHRIAQSKFPFRSMTFLPFVFSESTRLPLVPVDFAAQAYQTLVAQGLDQQSRIYHILGGQSGISARKVLAEMMLHVGLEMEPLALPYHRIPKSIWKHFQLPLDMLATLNSPTQFHSTHLEDTLPDLHFPHYKEYAPTLFRYADMHLFKEGAVR